jgi:hypothetical protein
MMRVRIHSILAISLAVTGWQAGVLGETKSDAAAPPEFKEVYDLIREHLSGMSEAQWNQDAVHALIKGLSPRVSLVTNAASAATGAESPLVSKSNMFDGQIAYVRVESVGKGLPNAVREAYQTLKATNNIKGVALDLRYAGGGDYASAAGVAELFIRKEQPLMNWGNGMVRSKENSDAISVPVAVLVNSETAGAAEALAAMLREAGAGIILGSKTAGQAMITEEFPLKNGDRLRIATAPVELGDGTLLSAQGLTPDISVEVSPADERAYYADAYQVRNKNDLLAAGGGALTNTAGGTNRVTRRPRFNEAELVRERKEGISEADMTALREREPEKPLVTDPALARALDLLKALALVRQSRS